MKAYSLMARHVIFNGHLWSHVEKESRTKGMPELS